MFLKLAFLLSYLLLPSNGANILGIFNQGGKSHHILGEVLFKELVRRGHNVTMVSPFPLKEKIVNYTDIHLTGILEDQIQRQELIMLFNSNLLNGLSNALDMTRTQTEMTLSHTEMQKLVDSKAKFDLIIMDWFLNYALLIYGDIFKAPIIPISSSGTLFISSFTNNPAPPSYISNYIVPFNQNMSFIQRTVNSLLSLGTNFIEDIDIQYHTNMLRRHYDNPPNFEELRQNIALFLSNGHYSIESPRPYLPNIIPIAGFHVQKPKELPEDIKKYMDEAPEGVILFSLGSIVKCSSLTTNQKQIFLKTFSKIQQRVLWKCDDVKKLTKVPSNVLVKEWLPQNDILAHQNIKLFISHGGLLSTIETIYHGVPVIGIPIFGDQKSNIAQAVAAGYALQIELLDLNEINLSNALKEILHNSKYKENVQKRSDLLKDQPLSPLDNAVFWVEHVIRHKGAPHLQNTGIYLKWYQYFLIDVILFVGGILFLIIGAICLVFKYVLRIFYIKEKTD